MESTFGLSVSYAANLNDGQPRGERGALVDRGEQQARRAGQPSQLALNGQLNGS